jgi:hypothetical protein
MQLLFERVNGYRGTERTVWLDAELDDPRERLRVLSASRD